MVSIMLFKVMIILILIFPFLLLEILVNSNQFLKNKKKNTLNKKPKLKKKNKKWIFSIAFKINLNK